MSSYYVNPLDPSELAARFSTSDILEPLQECFAEDWKARHLERIEEVLHRLPDREADLVHLYYFCNKKQTDIAEIFNVTQAAVSYRLKRALERIQFLIEMPNVTREEIYEDLKLIMPSELDALIFVEMFETSCQSEAANRLSLSQGRVRHKFLTNRWVLAEALLSQVECFVKHCSKELRVEFQRVRDFQALRRETLDTSVLNKDALKELDKAYCEVLIPFCTQVEDEAEDELISALLGRYASYLKVFLKISQNRFNILREVKLPRWSGRSKHVLVG